MLTEARTGVRFPLDLSRRFLLVELPDLPRCNGAVQAAVQYLGGSHPVLIRERYCDVLRLLMRQNIGVQAFPSDEPVTLANAISQ